MSKKTLNQQVFEKIVERANSGDQDAVYELRKVLDDHPQIWKQVANLGEKATITMLSLISGDSQLMRDSVRRELDQMRAGLSDESDTMIEKLCIDRVLMNWLAVRYADVYLADPQCLTAKQSNFRLKYKAAAERRFQAAVKALATLRKLTGKAAKKGAAKPSATVSGIKLAEGCS